MALDIKYATETLERNVGKPKMRDSTKHVNRWKH